MFNAESVLGNGSGLGCGDSYINIKALDSVSAFILTQQWTLYRIQRESCANHDIKFSLVISVFGPN